MAVPVSLSILNPLPLGKQGSLRYYGLRPVILRKVSDLFVIQKRIRFHLGQQVGVQFRRFVVLAVTEGSRKSTKSDENIPSWARSDSDEPPPWARDEGNGSTSQPTFEVPSYAYLLASAVTAIAAIGSVFEYVNQRPVFGIIQSDSLFYAPLLGFFAFAGVPMSAFLWFKSVQAANKEAEEQDRRDGYL